MIQVCGTYDKGNITSDNAISFDKAVKVMVTFNEEDTNVENGQLTLADFSFFKSRELLKNVQGSLSNAVIEERRSEL